MTRRQTLTPANDRSSGPAAASTSALGRYRLLRQLAAGGMSEVYLAYDQKQGQPVALKVLSARLADDQIQRLRFERESRLTLNLKHPHLVRGLAAGRDAQSKRRYLVLEYIDGPNAALLLERQGRLDVNDVVHIGIGIARALAYLHQQGCVHRDVKPDNIMLSPCGSAKLIDLGLAYLSDPNENLLTLTNNPLGTSYYMPWEQGLNSHWVDGRSDIFALGATMYHLLTGQVPFPGDNHDEVMRKKRAGQYAPAGLLNRDVPAKLELILQRMMARDPRQRWASADEVATALARSRLTSGLPSFADLGLAVQPSSHTRSKATDHPTRPDLRLRASRSPKSRAGDVWIIRFEDHDGDWSIRKATTSQLVNAIRKGRFPGLVFGARRPQHPFRPLNQFPEFLPYFRERAASRSKPAPEGFCSRLLSRLGWCLRRD
jgi:serine/threonine-protein kinase